MTSLNPDQTTAVEHLEGPMLVLAGAGSGKTRVVTFRIANLLKIGVPASEILAVTFTNKAAEEMRSRIEKLANHKILTCTFHSLCARILRESIASLGFQNDFAIYDEDDSEKLIKVCLTASNQKENLVKTVKSHISTAKNNLVQPEEYADIFQLYQTKLKEYNAVDFDDLLALTVQLLRDHPDVLEKYQRKWTFILIDEYQDTNAAQHEIIKLLAARHRNVFAVGDPDQSIYSWRGANVRNILEFEKDFPGARIVPLEQNYRSHTTILNAANALIKHNSSRYEKNLWSGLGPGEKICLNISENDHAEADFVVRQILKLGIPLSDCVIFYRTNFQSRVFEDALLRQKVPYIIIGGLSFYQRREIKDILAILRLVIGGADYIAFARTINLPKRGLGEAALEKFKEISENQGLSILDTCIGIIERKIECKLSAKQFEGLKSYVDMILALREMVKARVALQTIISEAVDRSRYLDYLREDPETYEERRGNLAELVSKAAEWEGEYGTPSLTGFLEELSLKSSADEKDPSADAVRMMTLHNGKGLEFTAVFLVGMEEDLFPHMNSKDNPEALEEERRLCYVGMTRAKKYLFLTASRARFIWGSPRMMRPSRFLNEIPSEYLQDRQAAPAAYDEETVFASGDEVHHRDFGTGIVQKSYQTSLGLTYDVFFPQANTTRSLVAKFAKLIRAH
jgi:DNA helicase-2/ATP-dependent DNA helicase PcrA